MVVSNSLVYQNRSRSSDELFNKIGNCKSTYFYKSEVNKYINVGAVTCTNIIGNKYKIKSNTSDDVVEVMLR